MIGTIVSSAAFGIAIVTFSLRGKREKKSQSHYNAVNSRPPGSLAHEEHERELAAHR